MKIICFSIQLNSFCVFYIIPKVPPKSNLESAAGYEFAKNVKPETTGDSNKDKTEVTKLICKIPDSNILSVSNFLISIKNEDKENNTYLKPTVSRMDSAGYLTPTTHKGKFMQLFWRILFAFCKLLLLIITTISSQSTTFF